MSSPSNKPKVYVGGKNCDGWQDQIEKEFKQHFNFYKTGNWTMNGIYEHCVQMVLCDIIIIRYGTTKADLEERFCKGINKKYYTGVMIEEIKTILKELVHE